MGIDSNPQLHHDPFKEKAGCEVYLNDLNKLQCNYKRISKTMGFVKIPFGYKNS